MGTCSVALDCSSLYLLHTREGLVQRCVHVVSHPECAVIGLDEAGVAHHAVNLEQGSISVKHKLSITQNIEIF